jgi:hypothetical protein
LELEQEVVDIKGNVGNGEEENLDDKQEDLVRNKLQCGGR